MLLLLVACGQISDLDTRTTDLENADTLGSSDLDGYVTDEDLQAQIDVLSARLDTLEALGVELGDDGEVRLLNGALEAAADGSIAIGGSAIWVSAPDGDGVRSVELGDGAVLVDPSDGAEVAVFDGLNVHIRSGAETTYEGQQPDASEFEFSGLGNLVIGYDEDSDEADASARCGGADEGGRKTGSHNLIVGANHCYEGAGAIVAGYASRTTGLRNSVLGGYQNAAYGQNTVVVGGSNNDSGSRGDGYPYAHAVVVGGSGNSADGHMSVVVAGDGNRTPGNNAVVIGGAGNTADGDDSVVVAGDTNYAAADRSSILGGSLNGTNGADSTVLGGAENTTGSSNTILPTADSF